MDYISAISKVVPGTFVPDMGAATRLDEQPTITAIPGADAAGGVTGSSPDPASLDANGGVSFKDTVKAMLDDVNTKLTTSDQATRDLASGKTNDLQSVVTSVEEANLALNFTTAMRSKLLDAYTEVSRMQV